MSLVKKYLERCMMHGAVTMEHLARMENKLLEEFNFPTFHSLGQGHFLDFLTKREEIKQVSIILLYPFVKLPCCNCAWVEFYR